MKQWFTSSRSLFLLAILLLLVTNAFVFAGIRLNRAGAPEPVLVLTERELPLPYRSNSENSGVSLQLNWRTDTPDYTLGNEPSGAWLDKEKMRELGFSEKELKGRGNYREHKVPLPRSAYIVLEYNGDSYREMLGYKQRMLDEARQGTGDYSVDYAAEQLERERTWASRLFAIDAGLDPDELRARYSDRSRFIICKGVVEVGYRYMRQGSDQWGYVGRINISSIHVPIPWARELAKLPAPRDVRNKPRYQVKLVYGSRQEPWVDSVTMLR